MAANIMSGRGLRETELFVIVFHREECHNTDPSLPKNVEQVASRSFHTEVQGDGSVVFREHSEVAEKAWGPAGTLPNFVLTAVQVIGRDGGPVRGHVRVLKGEQTKQAEQVARRQRTTKRFRYLKEKRQRQAALSAGQVAARLYRCRTMAADGGQC